MHEHKVVASKNNLALPDDCDRQICIVRKLEHNCLKIEDMNMDYRKQTDHKCLKAVRLS